MAQSLALETNTIVAVGADQYAVDQTHQQLTRNRGGHTNSTFAISPLQFSGGGCPQSRRCSVQCCSIRGFVPVGRTDRLSTKIDRVKTRRQEKPPILFLNDIPELFHQC